MSNALLAGVSGLQAYQEMLDVAGNNLANINSTAFKGSRVSFSDLLNETLREASQPTATSGGTNPVQVGSGVQVASVDRNMTQGSLVSTGQPLDMAIDGAGYFVLNTGSKDVYTRAGSFSVDANYNLVDPSTGYEVQRIGSQGVAEGFQDPSNNSIRIPYNVAMPAKTTTNITFTGNLSADENSPTTNVLASGTALTLSSGAVASEDTLLSDIQGSKVAAGDKIQISGLTRAGAYVGGQQNGVTYVVQNGDTLGTVMNKISQLYGGTGPELNVADGGTQVVNTTDNYVTSTGANASITITYDGVTRVLDKTTVTNTDLKAALTNAATPAGLNDLVAAINQAFNGATGTDGTILQNIASAGTSPADSSRYVLQFQGSGNGDIGNMTIQGTGIGYAMGVQTMDTSSVTSRGTAYHVDGSQNSSAGSTASIVNGEIELSDNASGYSQATMDLSYQAGAANPTGTFPLPDYFQVLTAGGADSRAVNLQVFDSQGVSHTLAGTFVRRDAGNVWDLVVGSVSGGQLVNGRVNGIKFLADGSYGGLTPVAAPDGSMTTDRSEIKVTYPNDPTNINTIALNLGTIGGFNGVSQFGGASTVAPSTQDGYAPGWLSSLSVDSQGVLEGVFTNGVRQDIAAINIATFQNPSGLQSVGGNYYATSTNSGEPIQTMAQSGGAGTIQGGSLEKSNVDTASEFVNLIQAQNGYQANARTIKVANDMLTQLNNLIQ
jgi:flagellar hook protein FlgE